MDFLVKILAFRFFSFIVRRIWKNWFSISVIKTTMQLGTGTGIAPFRSFLWKMFFEKHEDYKVNTKSAEIPSIDYPFKLFTNCSTCTNTVLLQRRQTSVRSCYNYVFEFENCKIVCTKWYLSVEWYIVYEKLPICLESVWSTLIIDARLSNLKWREICPLFKEFHLFIFK